MITVPETGAKVILGLIQESGETLEWKILGSFIGGEPSIDLFNFLTFYLEWSKKHQKNWE